VISPYAKTGYIDRQTLSFDAYDKFIEDDFLHGQRLDPRTDGRPDPRPDVRENAKILGNLTADFNFNRHPMVPVLLPVHPVTTLTTTEPLASSPTTTPPGIARYAVSVSTTTGSPGTVVFHVNVTNLGPVPADPACTLYEGTRIVGTPRWRRLRPLRVGHIWTFVRTKPALPGSAHATCT
jgi:hypothetical protein